ncbi:hypothetical protein H0H93_011188 [Arthromyces matolae]|nr:hypothetical protein H0H93_011188 [Arthromyces matolae]
MPITSLPTAHCCDGCIFIAEELQSVSLALKTSQEALKASETALAVAQDVLKKASRRHEDKVAAKTSSFSTFSSVKGKVTVKTPKTLLSYPDDDQSSIKSYVSVSSDDSFPATEPDVNRLPNVASSSTPTVIHSSEDHVPSHLRWYAVLVGRNPGVVQGSSKMHASTSGVKGNLAVRFKTEEEAQVKFSRALDENRVVQVNQTSQVRLTSENVSRP